MLTLALAFMVASFLVFPLFPVSQNNTFTHWVTPVAYAQDDAQNDGVLAPLIELLERTGLYNPPQKGTPPSGRQSGGAGRGPICALVQDEGTDPEQALNTIKALVPTNKDGNLAESLASEADLETDVEADLVGGLTIGEQPTFLFYLPYIEDPDIAAFETPQKRVAQFVLLDDDTKRPVLNELMAVELSDTPRLVEYRLSSSLETGKLYNWYFSVICDAEKRSRNPVVRGWIQRVELTPELQMDLDKASNPRQYLVYAKHGIWFDTVSALLKTWRYFPIKDDWLALLAQFKLNQVVGLEPVEPVEREVVNGNQLPANI